MIAAVHAIGHIYKGGGWLIVPAVVLFAAYHATRRQ